MASFAIARKICRLVSFVQPPPPKSLPRVALGMIFSEITKKAITTALTAERLWLVSSPKQSREAGSSKSKSE